LDEASSLVEARANAAVYALPQAFAALQPAAALPKDVPLEL